MDYWHTFENFASVVGGITTSYFMTMKGLIYRFLQNDLGVDVDFHFHQDKLCILFTAGFSILVPFLFIKFVCWCCPCYDKRDPSDNVDGFPEQKIEISRLNSKRWLRQAQLDFEAASNDFEVEDPATEWACYKCQQACEKAIKAYLLFNQRPSTTTHDLTVLAAETNDKILIKYGRQAQGIIGVISRMRYPDLLPYPKIPRDMYSMKDARTAIEITDRLICYVRDTCFSVEEEAEVRPESDDARISESD